MPDLPNNLTPSERRSHAGNVAFQCNVPLDQIEILGAARVYWSGWEGDHSVVTYRDKRDGKVETVLIAETQGGGPIAALRQSIADVEKGLPIMKAMLAWLEAQGPGKSDG